MWDNRYLDELKERHTTGEIGGGEDQIAKQHSKGELTARERVEALFGPCCSALEFTFSNCLCTGAHMRQHLS